MRYVAIGDSYTEGIGDELPDGTARGWADLVAQGIADVLGEPIEYANLAIRGRLIGPIIEEQLDAALALAPTLISFNGGGNDIMRPRADIEVISDLYLDVLARCRETGSDLLVISGANPTRLLPAGRLFQARGDSLLKGVQQRLAEAEDVTTVMPWQDVVLQNPRFWSDDRLHLNTRGHHRVAALTLDGLGYTPHPEWWDLPGDDPQRTTGIRYYRQYVGPWVQRRLTKRSSGDGRAAKYPDWVVVEPKTQR
ncbi:MULTISPECIES: SGNH/GDSL hydrolase family protein [Micrococcaceae]|uniref:SGNH/GDSL hydrolase family protein n=1 Tax=unclassified Kocuria TaxID=2649579 RepID=UPI001011FA6C|nr:MULTISPECIES: SGNH/GDSL hydrolase family protein [unclassified Kocuria]